MNKKIVVVGPARSGTSVTTGLLGILGVPLICSEHTERTKAILNVQNPKGVFEHSTINDISYKLVTLIREERYSYTEQKKLRKRFKGFLKDEVGSNKFFAFKGGLFHWDIETFLSLINDPYVLIIMRNIHYNAISWKKHMAINYGEEVSMQTAYQVVTNEYSKLSKAIDTIMYNEWKYKVIAYHDLIYNSVRTVKSIAKWIGVEWSKEIEEAVLEFIIKPKSMAEGE